MRMGGGGGGVGGTIQTRGRGSFKTCKAKASREGAWGVSWERPPGTEIGLSVCCLAGGLSVRVALRCCDSFALASDCLCRFSSGLSVRLL